MGRIRKTVGVIMYLAPFVAIFIVCAKAFGGKYVLMFIGGLLIVVAWFCVAAWVMGEG